MNQPNSHPHDPLHWIRSLVTSGLTDDQVVAAVLAEGNPTAVASALARDALARLRTPGDDQRELVTPAVAAEWLELNENNRNLRRNLAARFARDMAQGRWAFTGESIKFSKSGRLIDGQHRLYAIVQSGVSVVLLVTRGLPEEAQLDMDQGAKRAIADRLKLQGYEVGTTLGGILRVLYRWDSGKRGSSIFAGGEPSPSDAELRELVETVPWLQEVAIAAKRGIWQNASNRLARRPQVIGLAMVLFRRVDPDVAAEFFERLGSGADLSAGHPILRLRHRYQRINNDQPGEGDAWWDLNVLVQAWNAYRFGPNGNGEWPARLTLNPELTPFPEPI